MKVNINEKKIVLACSAGIDSIVLLDILVKEGVEVIIAHFNHLTRGLDNEKDYQIIKEYAKKHNLKVYYEEYDFSNIKGNFHDLAHKKRYDFFYQILKKENCNLALAHHAGDLVENQMIAYLRGSSIKAYAGFLEKSNFREFYIYRPLINYQKTDIINYQKLHNLEYNEDYSNEKSDYLRNNIRHNIVKNIKVEEELLTKKALQYAKTLHEANDFINIEANKYLDLGFKVSSFKKLHPALQKEVVAITLKKHNINTSIILISSIIDIVTSSKGSKEINLNSDYVLYKEYDEISIEKRRQSSELLLEVSDFGSYETASYYIEVSKTKANVFQKQIKLCYNDESIFPFTIRNRLSGDYIDFSFGRKKLNRLMIDKKISKFDRDKLIVIEKDNIIYVEDIYQKYQKNKVYISFKEKKHE